MVFQLWYTPIAVSYLLMISAVDVAFKRIGLQSVSQSLSCCFWSRQDSLKWHSLLPTVILKAPVKSSSTTWKLSHSITTYLLSAIRTSQSSLWFMTDFSGWCNRLGDPKFFGILFGSFYYCCHTHFFWSCISFWFSIFSELLCVTMQAEVWPSYTAWSFCWAGCRGLQIWLKGQDYSLHMIGFTLGLPTTVL